MKKYSRNKKKNAINHLSKKTYIADRLQNDHFSSNNMYSIPNSFIQIKYYENLRRYRQNQSYKFDLLSQFHFGKYM